MKIQKCTRVANRNPGPARRVLEWRRNFLPSRRRLRFNFSHEVTRTTVASQRLSRVWLIVGPWGRLLVTDHWAAGNFHVCNIPLWQNRLWFYCGDHGSSESLDPLSQIYCDAGKTWLPTSSSFLRSHGRWLLGDINSSVPSSKTSVYYGPYILKGKKRDPHQESNTRIQHWVGPSMQTWKEDPLEAQKVPT